MDIRPIVLIMDIRPIVTIIVIVKLCLRRRRACSDLSLVSNFISGFFWIVNISPFLIIIGRIN